MHKLYAVSQKHGSDGTKLWYVTFGHSPFGRLNV